MILSAVRDPYPTRDRNEGALMRRREPVVYSQWSDESPLSKEQTEQFESQGWLVLTDVLSSHELNALRAVSEKLTRDVPADCQDRVVYEAGSRQLRTLFDIHSMDGVLKDMGSHPRLIEIAQFLLGDEVYMHQSRLNFKSPVYGSGFEWHSDFETWHAEDGMPGMRAVSATVLLTDEISADGSLKFMPGSHKTFLACPGETPKLTCNQRLTRQKAGKPPAMLLDLMEENCGIEELLAPAGSVVLFDSNLMHGAGRNSCEHLRANLFYVYNAVSNALSKPYASENIRPEFIASRRSEALGSLAVA